MCKRCSNNCKKMDSLKFFLPLYFWETYLGRHEASFLFATVSVFLARSSYPCLLNQCDNAVPTYLGLRYI